MMKSTSKVNYANMQYYKFKNKIMMDVPLNLMSMHFATSYYFCVVEILLVTIALHSYTSEVLCIVCHC